MPDDEMDDLREPSREVRLKRRRDEAEPPKILSSHEPLRSLWSVLLTRRLRSGVEFRLRVSATVS